MKTSPMPWSIFPLAIATAGCGLTTTMREGPARPAGELATVASTDTIVAEIDGKSVQGIRADPNSKSAYLLPAGPHVIGFALRKRLGVSVTVLQSGYIRACLQAEAGHHYTTSAEVGVGRWKPHIFDSTAGEVPLTCESTESEIFNRWSGSEIERVKNRPFADLTLSFGWDFGGDDLVRAQFSNGSTQSLAAGQGPLIRVGAMVTPLWLDADRVGIGAGADIGIKIDGGSAANADFTLFRYPASLTLHTLLRVKPIWYVLVAGGIDKDEGISLSKSGDVSVMGGSSVTSRMGGVGRLALYWADADAAAIMFGLEYTRVTYDTPAGGVGANNAGFFTAVTWRP